MIERGIATANELHNIDPLEFALKAHKTGAMNIFANSTLTEADVIRRAFRDYGYKVKNSNPAVGDRFKEFANKLDSLIEKADPKGFVELVKARNKYAAAVGDTTREGGTFYKLKQSRKGGEKKNLAENAPTLYFYRTFAPTDLFNDVTNNVDKIMRKINDRQRLDIGDDLQAAVAEVQQAFADPVNGQLVFDLTDELGDKNFKLLRRAVTESLQDRWFHDYLKAVRLNRVGGKIKPEETYDFTRSADLEVVNQQTMVNVRRADKNGNIECIKAIYDK